MALTRCIGAITLLVAAARQASGFGLGIGRVDSRSFGTNPHGDAAATTTGAAATAAAVASRTGVAGARRGGFTTASAAVGATGSGWGVSARRVGGARGGPGGRNTGALMMNRSKKAKAKEQQFTEGMCPSDAGNYPVGAMEDDPTLEEVLTAVRAADERKAENIVAIRVAQLTVMTEYMVVLEGNSRPQNQAIAQNIEEKMEEMHKRKTKSQGAPESGWILLDYGDIIVHIMTPKSRSYYDLESFWANGVEVPLEGVLKPNAPEQQEVAAVEEVDPFWS
eukprot:g9374.t2